MNCYFYRIRRYLHCGHGWNSIILRVHDAFEAAVADLMTSTHAEMDDSQWGAYELETVVRDGSQL